MARTLELTLTSVALLLSSACDKNGAPEEPPARTLAEERDDLLEVGEPAPDFEATAHTGQPVSLSALRGKVVVLYFYPKDGTPGCTTEAQHFAEEHDNLEQAGAVVVGVSTDDNSSHREFAREHALPFLLLPDTERSVAEAYGVGSFLGMHRRVTYVIDRQGRVARVYPSVDPNEHAAEILRALAEL